MFLRNLFPLILYLHVLDLYWPVEECKIYKFSSFDDHLKQLFNILKLDFVWWCKDDKDLAK